MEHQTPPSALRARDVLDLVRTCARSMLDKEPASSEWDIHWVAAVTLLRMVGHALEKDPSQEIVMASNEAHEHRWPQDPMWTGFIKGNRDKLLHEIEMGVEHRRDYYNNIVLGEPDRRISLGPVTHRTAKLTIEGLVGLGPVEQLVRAIGWWETEIRWIEERAATRD